MSATSGSARLRTLADLPGPRGWPLLGNVPGFDSSRAHLAFEAWERRHGPLYRVDLAGRRLLVVSDPDAIMAMLRDRPDTFSRTSILRPLFAELGFVGVFAAEGDEWRRQRPLVMRALDPAHLRRFHPVVARAAQRLRQRWLRVAGAGPVDVRADLTRYTTDVVCSLAFGVDVATLERDAPDPLQGHLDRIFAGLQERMFSVAPWWRLMERRRDRLLRASVRAAADAVDGYIAGARARMAAEPGLRAAPENLLQALIAAAEDDRISEAEVRDNVFTMLLAGEDTTAGNLAWALHLLSRWPEVQAAAREEALTAVGTDGTPADFDTARALPLLEAVLMEALRLKPVAPLLGLTCLREVTIMDVAVPARTRVVLVMRSAAVDGSRFPEPQRFDPSRWLAGGADTGVRRTLMPFGAGPRFCPGRYLAMLEAKTALASILAAFEVLPGGGEVQELNKFTMTPEGLRLRLVPRTLTPG